MSFHIHTMLSWKSIAIEPKVIEQTTRDSQSSQDLQSPGLLGELTLEIVLTGYGPSGENNPNQTDINVNKRNLESGAFQHKTFHITLEKAEFAVPGFRTDKDAPKTRHRYRLVFDKSPYPPEPEWKQLWKEDFLLATGDDEKFLWEYREFVGEHTRLSGPESVPITKVTITKPWSTDKGCY
jgi:hypothetical protein